ncbi:hypothetical protein BDN72DRAFT_860334 [Pluteus cervinus]|uniref:Uncharacterized protein n=1 Tax=Pluteus cervinus TaxID=181527 RepID=A0ACD3AK62_9AGAR|nr:hypothetical protein BDN72DRAFT_860334 [Pluteus cervinus]
MGGKRESVMDDKSVVKVEPKTKRELKTPRLKSEGKPDVKLLIKQTKCPPATVKDEDKKKILRFPTDEKRNDVIVISKVTKKVKSPPASCRPASEDRAMDLDDDFDPNDIVIDKKQWEFMGVWLPPSRHTSTALRGGNTAAAAEATLRGQSQGILGAAPEPAPSFALRPSPLTRDSSLAVSPPRHRSTSTPDAPGKRSPGPLVPMDPIVIRIEEDVEEDFKKMNLLKPENPDFKIKKVEEMQLSADSIRQRLLRVGLGLYDVPLEKSLQDHTFPRNFIQRKAGYGLGGNLIEAFPDIKAEYYEKTGLRYFAYANTDMQVHAPQVPGAPGLFFFTGSGRMEDDDFPELMTTFTRFKAGAWCYMGLYQFYGAASLTKEEWATQTPKSMNAWAKKICSAKWGASVLVRIACRKQGKRKLTKARLQAVVDDGSFKLVTEDEVKEAFAKGEETLLVCAMKCVGYDTNLQLDLIEKFETWIPKPRKSKKAGEKRKRGENQGGSSKMKKRKTAVKSVKKEEKDDLDWGRDEDDSEPDDDDYDSDD